MKLLATLDAKDRKLLIGCLITVVVLAVVTAFFSRDENRDDNPLPSTYLTGRHGARAAFEMLQARGYGAVRWEQPLSDLASRADAQTVVIFAAPTIATPEDRKAVRDIVGRGGRVLVTGWSGGILAPDGDVRPPTKFSSACKLAAQGLDSLADSGEVWMSPDSTWGLDRPPDRVEYNCAGAPAVVEYASAKGQVVWWASSTPLENGSIGRADNLSLFLNSLGPRDGRRFYWDESLHGEIHSDWFYARGPALTMLLCGLAGIGLLVLFSFSRRRGPLRDLPRLPRTSPVEFLEALGSLYAEAGASATAVDLAWERFRRRVGDWCGLKAAKMSAAEVGSALRRRFPLVAADLEKDLADCEAAIKDDRLAPKRALALVQALNRYSEALDAAARPGPAGIQRV